MSIHWGGRGAGHISRWSTAVSSAALSLNFLSGALDPRITFARATTATFIGSDGLIQSAAIDAPRFDYDPVTLAAKGLLVEETRTNLLLNSLINGTSLTTQSVTVTAVPHTISFYGTGTITLSGAATATVVGTGVYPNRRTLTFTPIVGALLCTVTGSVQYAQVEAGSFATSFIPTAGTTVPRSADLATMTGTNFSNWYNQAEGTFVAQYDSYLVDTTTRNAVSAYASGATSNNILLMNTVQRQFQINNSGNQADLDGGTPASGIVTKVAGAYKVNDFALSLNGGAVVTDTLGTVPTVNTLGIGISSLNLTPVNGHIRQITYYKTRLSNAQLQALAV